MTTRGMTICLRSKPAVSIEKILLLTLLLWIEFKVQYYALLPAPWFKPEQVLQLFQQEARTCQHRSAPQLVAAVPGLDDDDVVAADERPPCPRLLRCQHLSSEAISSRLHHKMLHDILVLS